MSSEPRPIDNEDVDELVRTLEAVDDSGVLRETAAAAFSGTRSSFLRRAAGAAASLTALAVAADADGAASTTKNDTSILQFDLVLEYLQAGLYTEAERLQKLTPKQIARARVLGQLEREHVR